MSDVITNSKAICILGMHRSGTSAVARCINLLGAYLGENDDLMTPLPDNPEGFWELNDIINLQDRILQQIKRSWDATTPLPEKWYLCEEIKPFREELIELINVNFKDHKLWAWKDPRTSLLLDIWKDVLKELDVELSSILVVRNPLDVAKSLEKRNGLTHDKSFGIWFNYNIAALKATASTPRVFIAYDKLLNNWEPELKRCAAGLDLPWPSDNSLLKEKMQGFIRPNLCHSSSDVNDLKKADVPYPVVELYGLLEGLTDESSVPDQSLVVKVEELSKEYQLFSRFFQEDMDWAWEVNQKWESFDQQLEEVNQQLASSEWQVIDRERQIESLKNTLSWKITTPLRRIGEFFRS